MFEEADEQNFARRLAELCPELAEGWRPPPSPRTLRYNCYAFAGCDERRRWVPRGDPDTTWWPLSRETLAPGDLSIEMFVRSYEAVGFSVCESEAVEPEVDRIALFADSCGDVVHAARQNEDGSWTSKLGEWEDITHDALRAVEGGEYGQVVRLMSRLRAAGVPVEASQKATH